MRIKRAGEYLESVIISAGIIGTDAAATMILCDHAVCLAESDGWKNKLFMPASAARYFIRITAVRCERLQEISDEDCIKEGVHLFDGGFAYAGPDNAFHSWHTPREAYAALIDTINGRGTWDSNPWVWAYGFEITEKR